VLFLSFKNNCPVIEVPVTWEDVDGSHLNPIDAALQMVRDMLLIRFLYAFGVWKLTDVAM
jgi:dolichyl-phosphate beta-glucosyltransferase